MSDMKYDLIVIGAGPAGLMAAKTAAERGLKVLIVELKRDIADNLRLCASVLYIQPGFHGETEHLEDDKIVFVENDFFVRYDGGYHPIWEWCYVSESGHRLRMGKKHYPAAFALDKANILTNLIEDIDAQGVTMWRETAALKVENTDTGVRVLIQRRSEEASWIEAGRCIVADGVCSRVTQVSFPEVWKKRVRLTGAVARGYLVENLNSDWGDNVFALVKNRYGSSYFVPSPARTPDGNIIWKVIGSSADPLNQQDYAQKTMDLMMKEGPLSNFFKNIKILARTGTAWDIYTPIYEPAVGNTLLIGDVCSMQEVDIQGALPCGFNAGNAIADHLDGKPGFQEYTAWWNKAFEFNVSEDPARDLAQGFGLFALGAEVLDYWFSIMEHEVLNSFIDHNQLGALLERRYRDYRHQMEKERPDIVAKLDKYFSTSAEEAYQGKVED